MLSTTYGNGNIQYLHVDSLKPKKDIIGLKSLSEIKNKKGVKQSLFNFIKIFDDMIGYRQCIVWTDFMQEYFWKQTTYF